MFGKNGFCHDGAYSPGRTSLKIVVITWTSRITRTAHTQILHDPAFEAEPAVPFVDLRSDVSALTRLFFSFFHRAPSLPSRKLLVRMGLVPQLRLTAAGSGAFQQRASLYFDLNIIVDHANVVRRNSHLGRRVHDITGFQIEARTMP